MAINRHNKLQADFDPPLDSGIRDAVIALNAAGIETYESCEGGQGHSFLQPSVRFHGDRSEGFRALAIALQHGLSVSELRRIWSVIDGELNGPYWELTFIKRPYHKISFKGKKSVGGPKD